MGCESHCCSILNVKSCWFLFIPPALIQLQVAFFIFLFSTIFSQLILFNIRLLVSFQVQNKCQLVPRLFWD